jgi:hypothetical protein
MKKLLRLLLLVGIVIAIVKAVSAKKEWSGLSEAEARAKIDGKLARRVDDLEKRAEIADKVVEQMKSRGMIAPAPVQPVDDVAKAAEETTEAAAAPEPGEAEAETPDQPSSDEPGDPATPEADSADAGEAPDAAADTGEEEPGSEEESG